MSSPASFPLPAPDDSRGEVARAELSADALDALAVDTPLLPPREPLGARMASYFGRHLLLLFCLSFGCLWAILSVPSPFNRPDFVPGDLAPRDYVAPQNAFLPDRAETLRRRAAAAALVTPAYDPAPSAQAQALFALREVVARSRRAAIGLGSVSPLSTKNLVVLPAEKRFEMRAGWRPDRALLPTLRALQSARWKTLEGVAESAVREAYLQGRIRSDVGEDLNTLRPLLRRQIAKSHLAIPILSIAEREIILGLAATSAKFPNVVVNHKATGQAREAAADATLPVFLRIEANMPLVREGERVTPEQFAQLGELGLIAPRFRPLEALANGALCLLLVAGAAAYLARGRRDLVIRPSALWLVAVVPILFLFVFRMFLGVPHADFMMVPLAATAAMLLTVLIDARVGLPAGFVVAALCALMARSEAGLFLAATLSAWIGALSVTQLASRFALLRSVALLTITNAILAFSLGVLRESNLEELLSSAAWSALAGAGSVVAMAGLAIFLERPFGITSQLRLLELLAPDETVIRRMQLEAPGTYTHSMTVAILAESAAKAVGADPLLCRVAGLYHDIGKLRRPHCFIENQSGDNIHDRLSPGLSALLIKAHVKDGLELGRAIRLPAPVLEVVASHHGTSLIAYFYHRALKNSEDSTKNEAGKENAPVDESVFRYPGPKPSSREAAVVMLADAVEASARSLPQITPEILENHVQSLIAAKLSEGELDECDLSLKDLSRVRDSLASVLRGVLHGRIAYPDTAALSGQLSNSSRDWVRETLGEETTKNGRNATRMAQNISNRVADPAQKRQNKEERRKTPRTAPQTSEESASATKNDAPTALAPLADDVPAQTIESTRAARRRFKPSFHAPRNGTSTLKTPKSASNGASDTSSTRTQPELEPGRASSSARPEAGTPDQESGQNGAGSNSANGAAANLGAQEALSND
ncbi:hypothetical protein B1R32_10792 [Abditibacterium utsteinense]|uniref:HD domain-containing protein n=1 Tax=Abditibacterium utsteinense TaxID=1960156 RepID=A0A2S8STE4_9BACT|nr:HDIG domain-containing metalloprotein [Abditibacterium utsteinense]PQV64067.1 hypothetical protein B1R32_10792 [Abditibacterium utsteinense]